MPTKAEKTEIWRKRHAIQIASQLPEGQDDALAVLAYARELVADFMSAGKAAPKRVQARAAAQSQARKNLQGGRPAAFAKRDISGEAKDAAD